MVVTARRPGAKHRSAVGLAVVVDAVCLQLLPVIADRIPNDKVHRPRAFEEDAAMAAVEDTPGAAAVLLRQGGEGRRGRHELRREVLVPPVVEEAEQRGTTSVEHAVVAEEARLSERIMRRQALHTSAARTRCADSSGRMCRRILEE